MRYGRGTLGMIAVAFGVFAASAQAQDRTMLTAGTGAGATFPVGNAADRLELGWNAQAQLGLRNASWPVGLRLDLIYNSLSGDDVLGSDNDLQVIAGLANIELKLNRGSDAGLFLVGGPGYYNMKEEVNLLGDRSDNEFGVFGGAGYRFAMTNLLLSVE
ncbi:MAG: outer membrane beta-barrel protein, partial [Gemmatimonadales bacterium]